jgi:hypothetical protein
MTTPDPIAMLAQIRAQGWKRAEVTVTARQVRLIVEDDDDTPKRTVTSGRKTPAR